MTIALCLAVVALLAVSCFGLWVAWAVAGILRAALVESGARHDALQARFLALAFDRDGSRANASAALEQALGQRRPAWPDYPPPGLPVDELNHMAGG